MTGSLGTFTERYSPQRYFGPVIAGNRAPQAAGMGQQVAWLGQAALSVSWAGIAPLAKLVRDVSIKTLSTIGPAGISLLWLIPDEIYKAMSISKPSEFSARDREAETARTVVLRVLFASSLCSGALTLKNRIFHDNSGCISRSLSISPKLLAYFFLNQALNFPESVLDRSHQDTDQALIAYAFYQAMYLALLSNLVHQNSKKSIQLLKSVPQEERVQQKLVAGVSAALVAGINLFMLQRMIDKVLTIVPGIFILSEMNNPEKGVIFRGGVLPYLSNQNKQCNLLFINGLNVEKKLLEEGRRVAVTLLGGKQLFQLCDVHMAVVHTAAEFISALRKGKNTFGKVENLLINGHGNTEEQLIGSFYFSPDKTPELIEEMKNYIDRNASVILAGCMSADPSLTYFPDTFASRVAKLLEGPTVHGFLGSFNAKQVELMVEKGRLIPSMTDATIKSRDPGNASSPPKVTYYPAGKEKVVSYQENPPSMASKVTDYIYSIF